MRDDIYEKFANHIDEVYGTGVVLHDETSPFVKIFRKSLTQEEVTIALQLNNSFVTSEMIANCNNISVETADKILDGLAEKGIIFSKTLKGVSVYKLLPYFPGIVETLITENIDSEVAGYIQEYINGLDTYKKNNRIKIIHTNYHIKTKPHKVSFDELKLYLDKTDTYSVSDCFCRKLNKINGRYCGHPIKDMCIQLGANAEYYIRTGKARKSSREAVEQILLNAEKQGLYHEIYPVDDEKYNAFICNCCTCGCMFMRFSGRTKERVVFDSKITVDRDLCINCGQCITVCPESAIHWDNITRQIEVDKENCFTCGLCVIVCQCDAIRI